MNKPIPPWRSLLFVPADDARRCAKACTVEADAVILDLEDGVAADRKTAARACIEGAAAALREAGASVVVRINSGWHAALADLDVAVHAGADAIMVPKVEDAARLRVLAQMLAEAETMHGREAGRTGLIALVESPAGLPALPELAAVPQVIGLAFGSEDFCLELGVAPTPAVLELPSKQLALAAAARGLMALAVPLSIINFRDTEAYAAAVAAGAGWGINGALCIHPAQVAIANRGFAADPAQAREAQRIVDAWQARAEGAAVVALDGQMIDLPVIERARRLLARAASLSPETRAGVPS